MYRRRFADCGRTRVLTYRVAYLLQQGVPAGSIMALTFTNKAAREMKERIKVIGERLEANGNFSRSPFSPSSIMMGTFHSICTRLIRPHADLLGYTRDFSIYDTTDSKSLLKSICKERGLDEKTYKPAAVLSRISNAKNAGTRTCYGKTANSGCTIYQRCMNSIRHACRPLTRWILTTC